MSADNGIYVGKFPTVDPNNFEYRVIHAQAIENLSYETPDNCDYSPEEVVRYFGQAYPFSDEKRAQDSALRMEKEILSDDICPILEYGISSITFRFTMQYYRNHEKE